MAFKFNENWMNDPKFLMGLGMLGGSGRGTSFGDTMAGGLKALQQWKLMDMQQKEEDLKKQKYEKELQDDHYRRLQAGMFLNNNPQVAAMMPGGATSMDQVYKMMDATKGTSAMQNARALTDPNMSPEMRAELRKLTEPHALVQINDGSRQAPYLTRDEKLAGNLDPDQPYVWDKNGIPTVIKSTGYTEGQLMAANYADRMYSAENEIINLYNSGYEPGKLYEYIASGVPIIGNFALSDSEQGALQAAEDWIRAKLRKESGAVIAKEEMAKEYSTYFPMPGDSTATIKRKAKARQTAMKGMARMSGGSYEPSKLPEYNFRESEGNSVPWDEETQRLMDEIDRVYPR